MENRPGGAEEEPSRHLACTVTAGIIRRARRVDGEGAVERVLATAGSRRDIKYLEDVSNWISIDEVLDLFRAAGTVLTDPQLARHVGEDAVRQYAGTQMSTVLRSLGSVEEVLSRITTVASKFSTVSEMKVLEVGPGQAVLSRALNPGFEALVEPGPDGVTPITHLCEWASGLISAVPGLFALPPATVVEEKCQGRGDDACLMRVTWDSALAARAANPEEHITALEGQFAALSRRFESLFAAAGDLIADDDIHSTLAKMLERAATAVRAPSYLLVARPESDAELEIHSRGLAESRVAELADVLLDDEQSDAAEQWLVADIRSSRRFYGRIAAMFDTPQSFFPQERLALEQYARYAANALDRSIALADARRGHEETQALLEFARSLAGADSAREVARRLADAVPLLVDCDRVTVFLRREGTDVLTCAATYGYPPELEAHMRELHIARGDTEPELSHRLFDQDDPRPVFFHADNASPFVQEMMRTFDSRAIAYVPIVARGNVLGVLSVAVTAQPARLRASRELNDRLSGVVAQAAVGLENGELIDRVSHQANHDALTGLANRTFFAERFEDALAEARATKTPLGLFYVDLDDFKQVNDAYGHAMGDELLCQVAARLLATVRAGDTVARLGGDEFAIVLRDAEGEFEVDTAAARVSDAFDEPFLIGGREVTVSASVGRAVWPHDADELDRLMHHADASMYSVKRASASTRQLDSSAS